MLNTETNTRAMERRIRSAARHAGIVNARTASLIFEHGQWWVENIRTGAQWAVNDSSDPLGFDFEQVTRGDEY